MSNNIEEERRKERCLRCLNNIATSAAAPLFVVVISYGYRVEVLC